MISKRCKIWLFVAAALIPVLILGGIEAHTVFQQKTVVKYTVLLDPGHGGMDGGVLGRTTGVHEDVLNLAVALKLKKCLEAAGVRVLLTRMDNEGLREEGSQKWSKSGDMRARRKLIVASNADVVVSIHMNAFPDRVSRGGQVFFRPESEPSQLLAQCIQDSFLTIDKENHRLIKKGDFYILKSGTQPSVLVECGFLSHPAEEKLLMDGAYQDKLAWCLFNGIMGYLKK